MWLSPEKRRILAKETAQLPYLTGVSRQEGELATEYRNEILETVFDQFIRPDDASPEVTNTSHWKRALQLWKSLLIEERPSYFIDLNDSEYIAWIKTGEATVLPCTGDEVEDRNKGLPQFQGNEVDVSLAKEVRATLLKFIEHSRQSLVERNATEDKIRKVDEFCETIKKEKSADWFLDMRPRSFLDYENVLENLVKVDFKEGLSSKVAEEMKRLSELGKEILTKKKQQRKHKD